MTPLNIETEFGSVKIFEFKYEKGKSGSNRQFCVFRHGIPHSTLPHHINYQGYIAALQQLGVKSLLITSSVGVLNRNIPLFLPMLVTDILMPYNTLPDGSTCTMFVNKHDSDAVSKPALLFVFILYNKN